MKKIVFVLALLGVFGCHKPSYTALDAPWEPDYKVDRSENAIIDFEKQDAEKMPAAG